MRSCIRTCKVLQQEFVNQNNWIFWKMAWAPNELNDFELHMANLQPDKNLIFQDQDQTNDKIRKNFLQDRRRGKQDSELALLSTLHERDIIPKVPGKLLDRQDLVNSDPSQEAVKMMRSLGMQPSISEQMVKSRTIAGKKKQPKIIYDRNRPIFFDDEFFKFKLKPKIESPVEVEVPTKTEPIEANDSTYFDCRSTNSSYYSCSG